MCYAITFADRMYQKNRTLINSNTAPPPYRPPAEIEELLKRQGGQRHRTVKLPKRNWIQRNPRIFQVVVISVSLLTFFSKPLYDLYCNSQMTTIINDLEMKNRATSLTVGSKQERDG